jgi:hypothetical protein
MKNVKEINYRGLTAINIGDDGGAFNLMLGKNDFIIIASFGDNWDHVSVSMRHRCPTWEEMCFIKDLFFYEDETVIQYHPHKKDYINNHPYCLHMWKPQKEEIPVPKRYMIGV